MSFDRLTACLTRIDAEYKAPELAQTSKKHSFSESAERVLFVYLALAMLDRCIPVAPDCFPAKNNRRYIQCTIGKACIHETSGTAAPSSARTPLSRIIRSRPSSFRLRRSSGSGKCGQTRITTAGNPQIICFFLVHCTENCCSLF